MSKPKNAVELRNFLVDVDGKVRRDHFEALMGECQEGKHGLSRYSIKDLAESFGVDLDRKDVFSLREDRDVMEAGGIPVSSTLFPQITGQLLFSEIRASFDAETVMYSSLVPVVSSMIKGTEIVPSIVNISAGDVETVAEGQSYPRVGVTEEYFTLPSKTKRGAIIELTREAVHFDKTGMLVGQAQGLGTALGVTRENETMDSLLGHTASYSRNGTASASFLTAGAYINNQSALPLTDWLDIETAEALFDAILDPNTSEPLMLEPRHLIVSRQKRRVAQRILTATGTRSNDNLATAARTEETLGANPVSDMGLQLLSSKRLTRRITNPPAGVTAQSQAVADGTWLLGDISKFLSFYEVWPLALMQKGAEAEAAFDRDVNLQFKASYYGVCAVREPRHMLRLEDTVWA